MWKNHRAGRGSGCSTDGGGAITNKDEASKVEVECEGNKAVRGGDSNMYSLWFKV